MRITFCLVSQLLCFLRGCFMLSALHRAANVLQAFTLSQCATLTPHCELTSLQRTLSAIAIAAAAATTAASAQLH